MKQIKQLKDVDVAQDGEFHYEYADYKLNYDCKKFFERAFGVKVLAAYSYGDGYDLGKKTLDLGGVDIILFLSTGRILQFTNSEWGGLEIVK